MYAIKDLLILNQYQAYCKVKQLINKFPKHSIRVKDGSYLVMNYDENNKKPMLCIHLDTVDTHRPNPAGKDFALPPEAIYYDTYTKQYSIIKGYDYVLGADDRAGLWVALRLLADKDLYDKYCYGFFFDEEIGGKGSTDYAKDFPRYEDGVTCFIGLDRRGTNQVATYGYDNQKLINIFTDRGYKEVFGSFTDASNLAETKACVNLSVGYDYEHTSSEILDTQGMKNALATLQTLYLSLGNTDYLVDTDYSCPSSWYTSPTIAMPTLCECCGEHKPLYDEDTGYQVCGDCLGFLQ